jgi:hypothetical protein
MRGACPRPRGQEADQPAKTVGQSEEPALDPVVDDSGAEEAETPEPDETTVTECDVEVTVGGSMAENGGPGRLLS